ncbi:protein zwilch [Sitodiplosis mosellana]|uniref:protein zwilch n=1 Tax=Sitodiplosis mosellana TaxID=263140 RepID=UPI00244451F2|nr:protein zwilch [Sitodiplosis mosellana]
MANFYAKIRQLVKDCDISYIEPLSYMKHFTTSENSNASASDKIVLFYKKGYPSTPPAPKTVKSPVFNDESHMHDLTGSPLRDSCQFDVLNESVSDEFIKKNAWKDEEEKYHSIALNDAQVHINQILSETPKESTPKCWAICDQSDEKTMLLSTQMNGSKWRRGILRYNGVVDFKPINLIELQSKHLSYVVKQYGPIEGMIDNYYRLSNDAMLQVSRPVNGSMAQSIINDGKVASKMVLHQTIQVNNFKSVAKKFWIQLGILDDMKETIVSYKELRDLSCLVFKGHGGHGDIAEIKQEIYDMLTQPIPIGVTDEEDVNEHKPNTSIDKIVENASTRESGELTDQLWDVLRGCSSYSMLKEAIEHIFTSAAKINVVNMPSNQSRLAHLIRDVSDHRIAIPRLNGSEPLELLLEIGMEKVNKDYEYIFVESKLCSAEDLRADKKLALSNGDLNVRKSLKTQFTMNNGAAPRKTLMHKMSEHMDLNDSKENVGFQNSQFNLKNIEEDLARFGRIHLILEHLIMIKLNLNLENVFTTFLDDLRRPLVPFGALKEMSTDFREIPVTNTKILTKTENIPHRQRVFLKSRNQFKIIRNTFYFSVDPIFPPHVFKCMDNSDTKTDVYYAHQYLVIENA